MLARNEIHEAAKKAYEWLKNLRYTPNERIHWTWVINMKEEDAEAFIEYLKSLGYDLHFDYDMPVKGFHCSPDRYSMRFRSDY